MKEPNNIRRSYGLFVILLLGSLLCTSHVNARALQQDQVDLVILVTQAPLPGESICLGQATDFHFLVGLTSRNVPGFIRPAAGAVLTIEESGSVSMNANQDGSVFIGHFPQHEGDIKMTITARDDHGHTAKALILNYKVVECGWKLQIHFLESYQVITGVDWWVNGVVTWEDTISPREEWTENIVGEGKGQWSCFNSYGANGPLGVRFNQETQGEYNISWIARMEGENLVVELKAVPVVFPPPNLTWDFSLATNYSFLDDFIPPNVPTGDAAGNFLGENGIDDVVFVNPDVQHDVSLVYFNKPIFFNSPPPEIYMIRFILTPLPKE